MENHLALKRHWERFYKENASWINLLWKWILNWFNCNALNISWGRDDLSKVGRLLLSDPCRKPFCYKAGHYENSFPLIIIYFYHNYLSDILTLCNYYQSIGYLDIMQLLSI